MTVPRDVADTCTESGRFIFYKVMNAFLPGLRKTEPLNRSADASFIDLTSLLGLFLV